LEAMLYFMGNIVSSGNMRFEIPISIE
jgi:hypothetical protein